MSENLFRRKIIEHQGKWYLGEGKSIHRDLQQQCKDNDKLGHDDNSSFLASGTVKKCKDMMREIWNILCGQIKQHPCTHLTLLLLAS